MTESKSLWLFHNKNCVHEGSLYIYIHTHTDTYMVCLSVCVCLVLVPRCSDPVAHVLGEGNGTPLQYSGLENPMDGGAW